MKKTNLLTAALAGFFYGVPAVMAQAPTLLPAEGQGGPGALCGTLGLLIQGGDVSLRNLPCFLQYIAQTLIAVAGTLSVIYVMIGGYRYVMQGEEGKEEAKKTVTYALTGLALALMAWIITDIVLRLATQ